MERLLALIIICFYLVIFTGCAVKPIKSTQTINDLQVSLSETDENHYFLVDRERKVVSTSNGTNKLLKFPIPQNINLDQCFSVLDKNGKNFLSDKPKFRLSLIQDHRNLVNTKQSIEREIDENKRQETIYFNKYLTTISSLESNNAFINNSCNLPPQKELPSKPIILKCEKYDQCYTEGKDICTNEFISKKICNFALTRFYIPSTVTRPFCKSMLTHEDYGIDHFFEDIEEGAWADLGRLFFGPFPLIYKSIVEYIDFDKIISPCVDRFFEAKNNNLIRQWENVVRKIESEPYEIKNKCISLVNEMDNYSQKAGYHRNITETETNKLEIINREIGKLAIKNIEVNKCNN